MPAPFSRSVVPTAPLYILQRDFGRLGFESVTDPDMTRKSIVDLIVSGQVDRVAYVIEVFPLEGSSRDITDDIFAAVDHELALREAA